MILKGLIFFSILFALQASAKTPRQRPYNGYGTTLRGDIRTLGMAGASVGLADNFASSADNPAGTALTLDGGGIQVNRNDIRDGQIQNESDLLLARSYGVVFNEYPWGFSVGEWKVYSEGQKNLPTVEVSESRLQVSRLFLDNKKLSLGTGFIMGQGREKIDQYIDTDRDFGLALGAQYLLEDRYVLGATYTTPMDFVFGSADTTSSAVPNFFQPIRVPYRVALGLGRIPNRFMRWGVSLTGVGPTSDTALVIDETRRVGSRITFHPHLGITYRFAEFKNFEGNIATGSYYEVSRLEGADNRLHLNAGLELKPWFLAIGAAIDHAPRYQNAIFSVSIDVGQLLKRLDLVHKTYQPPRGGWFPDPFRMQDEGLDRGLVKHYRDRRNPGLIENVEDFPEKLQKRLESAPTDIIEIFD